MKANEKKVIIILVIVSILMIAGLIVMVQLNNKPKVNVGSGSNAQQNDEYTMTTEEGTIIYTSEKINEDKQIEGFTISNASLKEQNGETILSARITNNTSSVQKAFFGKVALLDKDNKEIGKIPVNVSKTKAGETIEIEASITERYANVYDFKLQK